MINNNDWQEKGGSAVYNDFSSNSGTRQSGYIGSYIMFMLADSLHHPHITRTLPVYRTHITCTSPVHQRHIARTSPAYQTHITRKTHAHHTHIITHSTLRSHTHVTRISPAYHTHITFILHTSHARQTHITRTA